jgi:predicted lipoprotein with Yx(FWY)xxD motif
MYDVFRIEICAEMRRVQIPVVLSSCIGTMYKYSRDIFAPTHTGVKSMRKSLIIVIGLVIVAILVAGCTSTPSGNATTTPTGTSTPYTVRTGSTSQLGTFLVDGKGITLYNFTIDSKDSSACTGGCVAAWPVFYASSIVVPSDLNASDFSSFTRADGSNQTAYKGMPLYYYVGDSSPGQTTGQGLNQFGGLWYVVPPDSPGYS